MPRWVVVGALLWAAVAPASDVADEAEFHFRRGLAFQRRGHFEEALAEFYASNRLVGNRNVQMNIASALGRLGLFDEAFRAYSELASQELSAEERSDIDRALAFLRPKLALVRVESEPKGATIFVQRRDLGASGVTSKTLALQPGKAKIILDLEAHRPVEVEVELEKGKEALVTRTLERITGVLEFSALPEAAEVRREGASGEVLLRGPGKLLTHSGKISLHIGAPGFIAARVETEVPRDATRMIDLSLAREPPPARKVGALVVRANLDGALVRVDGNEMGFTPVVIEGVEAGQRTIEVTREGREPYRETVELEDKQRLFRDIALRPKRLEVAGATQRLIHLEDAPASMTVITAGEIRAFGYTTVAEALRSVRGLHVWSDRAYDALGVRGFGVPENANARVLVLLNGHPMNDLIRGYGPIGAELGIDLTQVERIEVVRGGGMVFGGTAFLGLVNVVMRQPEIGSQWQFGASAATFDGVGGEVAYSRRGGWGEVLALVGIGGGPGNALRTSDGANIDDRREISGVRLFGRSGRLSLTAGAGQRTKSVPTGYRWSDGQKVVLQDGRDFAALQYDRSFDGGSFLLARLALDSSEYSMDYKPSDTSVKTQTGKASGLSGEFRFEWAASRTHRLTFGAAGRYLAEVALHASSTDGDAFDRTKPGGALTLYASDEWVPGRFFRLHLGMRVDPMAVSTEVTADVTKLGFAAQPHVALIVKPYAHGTSKLIGSLTARGPTTIEREFGLASFGRVVPHERPTAENPDPAPAAALAPENRIALELEHSHRVTDETTLTGTVFVNVYNNLLSSEPLKPGSDLLTLRNSGGSGAAGTELEARYSPGDGKILTVSGVFQGSITGSGARLVNFPEHVVSGRFIMPVLGPNLRAATELVFVGARNDRAGSRIEESLYWNVVLSGENKPWRLQYFGGVFNLLDERRPDPVQPDMAPASVASYGREVRVGASWRF